MEAEHPAAEALQVGMGRDRLHDQLAQAFATLQLIHEDIGDVSEAGEVRDDAREAALLTVCVEQTEGQ